MQRTCVDVVTDLHDIRQMLIDYGDSLQDTLAVLGGIGDPRVIVRAKQSALDFGKLITKVGLLAKSAAAGDEGRLMTNAAKMAELDMRQHVQRTFAEQLVLVFEKAREYDAQLDRIKRR
jgi:hypothetical protein